MHAAEAIGQGRTDMQTLDERTRLRVGNHARQRQRLLYRLGLLSGRIE